MFIQIQNVFFRQHGKPKKGGLVQILPVQRYGMDAPVGIGGVVVNATAGTTAGGVLGDGHASVFQSAAPTGLVYSTENMKELADAL